MGSTVISVHGLSKRYFLGAMAGHDTLRDQVTHGAKALWRTFQHGEKREVNGADSKSFWALEDISFDVREGEVLGIIGRNGAGKSTLLKILSQITEPTDGEIRVRGRVASLLEVGTGFHPELTGRENVYLNGAVLGMTRKEIRARFDEIVAFAEVEKFLDTPVKRYSSGMYVRLAFAVAAHLEPEILIVDEVLAVGDAAFQKKCLGKMSAAASAGRTVLFVSHNMGTVLSLCSRCLLLQRRLVLDGTPRGVVNAYLNESAGADFFTKPADPEGRPTMTHGRIIAVEESTAVQLELTIACADRYTASLEIRLLDAAGAPVGYASLGTLDDTLLLALEPGVTTLRVELTTASLANGSYYLGIDLTKPFVEYYDRAENCFSFDVTRSAPRGGSRVLAQKWGCGSVQLPIALLEQTVANP